MASSQKPIDPPPTASPQQNSNVIKGKAIGPQGSSDEGPTPIVAESSRRRGTPSNRHVSDSDFRPSSPRIWFDKETEKRRSHVVPRREKGKEIVEEEKPWDAKNILSFDGGGIRGLYSLHMLKQLMDQIKFFEDIYVDGEGDNTPAKTSFHPLEQPPNVSHNPSSSRNGGDEENASDGVFLPCHYFDYICGTSTGGLIAIMLGRLRMTVDDCIQEYEQLAGDVFGHAHLFHQTFLPTAWMKRPKYDTAVLETVIRGVTTRRGEVSADNRRTLKTESQLCRVFVFAYRRDGHDDTQKAGPVWEAPYIFRSYNHYKKSASPFLRNPGSASDFALWEVARATAAAPLYFAPMQVYLNDERPQPRPGLIKRVTSSFSVKPKAPPPTTSRPVTFIDGGFGPANNPSKEAWEEVTSSNEKVGTFVSIGTGRGRTNRFHTGLLQFVKAGIAAVGDPEPPHHEMVSKAKAKEEGFSYFRLNEFDGLPDLDFDEWKPRRSGRQTQEKIQKAYQSWVSKPDVQESFRRCALDLVRRRRLRTADESRWERFAVQVYFDCGENNCPGEVGKRWYNRNEFRRHLLTDHRLEQDARLDAAIRRDRRTWRYKGPENGGST